jgi:ABC-type phosphate transport system substrate-binding protein
MDFKRLFIISVLAIMFAGTANAQQRVIYFGNGTGVSSLKDEKLARVFTGKETYWGNDKQIIVCLPSTKSESAGDVCQKIYKQSVKDVQKFWLSIVFQGRAKSPKFFDTEEEMVDFIRKTPGAIGVLPSDKRSLIPGGLIITTI